MNFQMFKEFVIPVADIVAESSSFTVRIGNPLVITIFTYVLVASLIIKKSPSPVAFTQVEIVNQGLILTSFNFFK